MLQPLCDVAHCQVRPKLGKLPYMFSITQTTDSQVFEFQVWYFPALSIFVSVMSCADSIVLNLRKAENEEEMMQWIAAVRRCAVNTPGRPPPREPGATASTSGFHAEFFQPGSRHAALGRFVTANAGCCECSGEPVT